MDTRAVSHTEHGDYVQVLRVAYTKLYDADSDQSAGPPPPAPIYLSSKIFLILKNDDIHDDVHYRLNNWIKEVTSGDEKHKSRILSAETVEVYAKDADEKNLEKALEETFQCNRLGSLNTLAFMAIRVYFDVGFYGRNRSQSTLPSVVQGEVESKNHATTTATIPEMCPRQRSTSCVLM